MHTGNQVIVFVGCVVLFSNTHGQGHPEIYTIYANLCSLVNLRGSVVSFC